MSTMHELYHKRMLWLNTSVIRIGLNGNQAKITLALTNHQGALKGTNLRGQTELKRRFSLILADFCRFSPFPRKRSILELQIFAENRRFSQRNPQKTAGTRRKPQIGVCPLTFVPLSAALNQFFLN